MIDQQPTGNKPDFDQQRPNKEINNISAVVDKQPISQMNQQQFKVEKQVVGLSKNITDGQENSKKKKKTKRDYDNKSNCYCFCCYDSGDFDCGDCDCGDCDCGDCDCGDCDCGDCDCDIS